jgi:energy-coupling factor transporter ATP-binding protein EcfA2
MQLAISEAALNKKAQKFVLAVYRTGSGKTHIVRIVGAVHRW